MRHSLEIFLCLLAFKIHQLNAIQFDGCFNYLLILGWLCGIMFLAEAQLKHISLFEFGEGVLELIGFAIFFDWCYRHIPSFLQILRVILVYHVYRSKDQAYFTNGRYSYSQLAPIPALLSPSNCSKSIRFDTQGVCIHPIHCSAFLHSKSRGKISQRFQACDID
ncbi:hypothetical protein R3P38DRAFT_3037894, partial [Favolaschia claudopus]